MVVLDTKKFYMDSRMTLNLFRKLLNSNYYLLIENDPELKLGIQKLFSNEEVDEAIKRLILDCHRNIVVAEDVKDGYIIRYLEFGGEGLKSPHLISGTIKQMERRKLNVQ